ncbi:hypothetical protein JTE90_007099 [Oedothorax gibbosus]|uniref:Chitin-binding type-2 domain-containing protein n=1 Tax=Oedothorax gibbosus TaxID=931172 RepID=A0AAV6VQ78_9ARAC|nr:hypothetical protein JTE90_007099 [Oedothorax gibbosus]
MAAIPELVLVMCFLAITGIWEQKSTKNLEDPIGEALEEIVQTYEKTLSLYDLLAHFPIDNTITCPESDTVLPYPGDCTRYVTCRDYKAHIRGCPPGMKFDKGALRCRFDFQTNCSDALEEHEHCGVNEEYSECGPSCEQTCDEYRNDYLDCPEECAKGCFCKEGFVRGSLRNCIEPRKCGNKNMLEPWFLINARTKTRTPALDDEDE